MKSAASAPRATRRSITPGDTPAFRASSFAVQSRGINSDNSVCTQTVACQLNRAANSEHESTPLSFPDLMHVRDHRANQSSPEIGRCRCGRFRRLVPVAAALRAFVPKINRFVINRVNEHLFSAMSQTDRCRLTRIPPNPGKDPFEPTAPREATCTGAPPVPSCSRSRRPKGNSNHLYHLCYLCFDTPSGVAPQWFTKCTGRF